MKVLVFAGSIRLDSYHRKLARAAAMALKSVGVEATLLDLKDYPMPLYDGDVESSQGLPEPAREFKKLLMEHDGLLIASPEYNGSFSALLKNVIDWTSRPSPGERPTAAFRGKVAALVSTSPGPGGGQRGLRHLREVLEMIGVTVVPAQLAIPRATEGIGADGELMRPEDRQRLESVVVELAAALRERTAVTA